MWPEPESRVGHLSDWATQAPFRKRFPRLLCCTPGIGTLAGNKDCKAFVLQLWTFRPYAAFRWGRGCELNSGTSSEILVTFYKWPSSLKYAFLFIYLLIYLFIYLEREHKLGRGRESGDRIPRRLCTIVQSPVQSSNSQTTRSRSKLRLRAGCLTY